MSNPIPYDDIESAMMNGDYSLYLKWGNNLRKVTCAALQPSFRGSMEDIKEAVHIAYFQIWKSKIYDRSKSKIFTLLVNTSRCRLIDIFRKAKRHNELKRRLRGSFVQSQILDRCGPGLEEQPSFASHLYYQDHPSVISKLEDPLDKEVPWRAVLAGLRPIDQDIINLHYFHKKTHKQISDILSIPMGTVKSNMNRAISSMRKQLCDSTIS